MTGSAGPIHDEAPMEHPDGPSSSSIDKGRRCLGNPRLCTGVPWTRSLYILHLDLAKLNANSSGAPPIALVGIVFTAYTPTIAALLIAWRWPGAGGVRKLLKQVTRWRVHVGWYLVALLGPIPLLLLGDLIYVMLGGAAPHQWVAMPSGTAEGGMSAMVFTVGRSVPERSARSLVGGFWTGSTSNGESVRCGRQSSLGFSGARHLWPVAVPGGLSLFDWTDFPQTYLRLTATAILYAWLYNSSRGSLLLVLVAHGAFNVDSSIVQTPASDVHTIPIIVAILHGVAALGIVLATNPRTLTWRGARAAG